MVGRLVEAADDPRVAPGLARGLGDDGREERRVDRAGAGEGREQPAGAQQLEGEAVGVLV